MYSFNVKNGEYFTMNMILAALSTALLLVPLSHYMFWRKIEDKVKLEKRQELAEESYEF